MKLPLRDGVLAPPIRDEQGVSLTDDKSRVGPLRGCHKKAISCLNNPTFGHIQLNFLTVDE
jgi:hypothetical protein